MKKLHSQLHSLCLSLFIIVVMLVLNFNAQAQSPNGFDDLSKCQRFVETKYEECKSDASVFAEQKQVCLSSFDFQAFLKQNLDITLCQFDPAEKICNSEQTCHLIEQSGCQVNGNSGFLIRTFSCDMQTKKTIEARVEYKREFECEKDGWDEWKETANGCKDTVDVILKNDQGECRPEVTEKISLCGEPYMGQEKFMHYRLCDTDEWSDWLLTDKRCVCADPIYETKTQDCGEGLFGEKTLARYKQEDKNCEWGEWQVKSNNCLPSCDVSQLLKYESSDYVCGRREDACLFQKRPDEMQFGCDTESPQGCAFYETIEQSLAFCPETGYKRDIYRCHNYCANQECEAGATESKEETCPVGQLGTRFFERTCAINNQWGEWSFVEDKSSCEGITVDSNELMKQFLPRRDKDQKSQ